MNYCGNCGKALQPGAAFCANCGTAVGGQAPQDAPSAMQGLAQAGLEVQSFNAALVVGRVIGFAIGMAILWFFVGPAFADNPIGVIVAFFALGFGGLLLGQWLMLLLLRR